MLFIRCFILTSMLLSSLAAAQTVQQTLQITEAGISEFRQISVRVLAAYKQQPHYVGSTEQWHLFLKKEHRSVTGKQFTSIFGYKIPNKRHSVENGWELRLPSPAIDPDNCPAVYLFNENKTAFNLPPGLVTQQHCLQP